MIRMFFENEKMQKVFCELGRFIMPDDIKCLLNVSIKHGFPTYVCDKQT